PEPDTWETWLQQRGVDPLNPPEDMGLDPEKKAAVRTLPHADTPTTAFSDSLGRTFLTVAHNMFERHTNGDTVIVDEKYNTRVVFDIEGNQRKVIDAKDRIVMCYDYDMLGSPIHQASMEAGERWMLNNVAGNPIRTWDSRVFQRCMTYDALQRPVGLFVTDTSGAKFLAEKTEYGESKPDPETTNHRLKPWKVYDGAGVLVSDRYDFKGNPVLGERQMLSDYETQVDWAHNPQLENETFSSRTLYDALNRPIQIIAPHSSRAGTKVNVTQPVYNEANLLEREEVWLEQTAEPDGLLNPNTASQHAVKNINYNVKGQREFIEYGNGVSTTYKYDPLTFRLIHLQTMRGTEHLQDLFYTYDPAGNITAIRDDAQQTIYFNGQVVRPDADYTYDAAYRLIKAHGREHIGNASQPESTWNDKFRVGLAHPNDGQKMRNYFEFYTYDEVGNILLFDHKAVNGNWIRTYKYNEDSLIETGRKSNRLSSTTVSGATASYRYDEHGNITRMPHFANHADPDQPNMHWDFEDQLQMVDKGGGCKAYYVYDAAGQRVRKVKEQNGTPIEERIYLGGLEVYHKYSGGDVLERETLHIIDDKQRIALVETRTQGNDPAPEQLIRYQLGNHLGSACLELDGGGQIISYEEYNTYGSTSYQASQTETPKRYRYTGNERDEETGLYYHGARYYACWLGRWVSADPAGLGDGTNLYAYVQGRAVVLRDPGGTQGSGGYGPTEKERGQGGHRGSEGGPSPGEHEPLRPRGDSETSDSPSPSGSKDKETSQKNPEERSSQAVAELLRKNIKVRGPHLTQDQAEFIPQYFLVAVDELLNRGISVEDAIKGALLLTTHAFETMWGKQTKENPNADPTVNNFLSLQPVDKVQTMLKNLMDVDTTNEPRINNNPRKADPGTPTPHFRDIRQSIQAQLDIAYGLWARVPGHDSSKFIQYEQDVPYQEAGRVLVNNPTFVRYFDALKRKGYCKNYRTPDLRAHFNTTQLRILNAFSDSNLSNGISKTTQNFLLTLRQHVRSRM
ncbi:MAG: RHS repeat-associated core domain-containing protein, partial [Candidatus Aminicenantes bacterium]